MAVQPPAILHSQIRLEEPRKDGYAPHNPEFGRDDEEYNQGITDLYWIHLLEYECTQLRSLFLFEMERLSPEWLVQYRAGEVKRDFELAVQNYDDGFTMRMVQVWMDAYEKGERRRLRDDFTN
ncbi:hypothetical protein Slin14017_G063430 [Septoria linicola]|nr:hypothetical protein Slin14017_G063430 [Septoria linicola]